MPFSAWPRYFTPKNRVREPFYHGNENTGLVELGQRQRLDAAPAEAGSRGSRGRAVDDDERGIRSGGHARGPAPAARGAISRRRDSALYRAAAVAVHQRAVRGAHA